MVDHLQRQPVASRHALITQVKDRQQFHLQILCSEHTKHNVLDQVELEH
jgi:hypothetical protein